MERDRILNDSQAADPGAASEVTGRRRARRVLLAWLAVFGPLAGLASGGEAAVFGSEPGGRTIGGPAQIEVSNGSSRELLTFLHRGPTPVRFICLTGLNQGPGILTVVFKSRIGETITARLLQGETRVVCGQTSGVEAECHGEGGDCSFRWRIDEPR